ncbi:MAG TPA: hypothetical protein VGU69_11400 [Rhizomicrobium sp.]|nr:hypothetical protein [Rhizomicrobium sp.]
MSTSARLLRASLLIVAMAIVADVLGRIDPVAAAIAFWVCGAAILVQVVVPEPRA